MHNSIISIVLFFALVGIILLGRWIRRLLPDDHLSADSRDTVKLAMGLVATMTALLLGLLVSSAKGTYDIQRAEVIQMAAKVSLLNRVLSIYGSEAAVARGELRDMVADTIHRVWPDDAGLPGQLSLNVPKGDALFYALQGLVSSNDAQRSLKAEASSLTMSLAEIRVLMLAQQVPSIPHPVLIMVGCWLLIIFLYFSLLAPPNATTVLSLAAAAVSVAGAMFLIMELDQPFGGTIRISSEPMLNALKQLTP
jgi:Protein of unknown function (DUF4239)